MTQVHTICFSAVVEVIKLLNSTTRPFYYRREACWSVGTLVLLLVVQALSFAAPSTARTTDRSGVTSPRARPPGVCPPFPLLDEDGNVINPLTGQNADKPYSPKQTCGRCHDYDKITSGYHFMQGKGEGPTADQKARCLWVTSPGNYGGPWCSPAPLYPYLAQKRNDSASTIDMTSFTFLISSCGTCHPGGGPAEFDREGKRYDRWMADPSSGLKPGADNNFDGDYYQARWTETGVLEADCLLCHMPGYNYEERKRQINEMNLRWAATAGAGFARVEGSVKAGTPVRVLWNKSLFREDGLVEPHIVREPRNEACLSCHAKPGWKKRGANFDPRTDVHLRAGLKCVDCHPAGSSATDPRIKGFEEHQIGKGDDPGGHVRDDLDNTCRDCADCHSTGYLGAPIAKHNWLPPLHLEKIACQACHIPERLVKAALVQASDVLNPGTKISPPGKRTWTFYGPDGKYWNHYGELEMMGFDDQPTDPFLPELVRYKGKIYPVNRVHSAWPAIMVEGEKALMQPKMSSVYKMWITHQSDPAKYPELAKITDDNGDGVPEVNRPEEIDALIASVTQMLKETGYPMEGKRVVWVMDDRLYLSGTEYKMLEKHPWEASPYGNVHKYNHDVYAAKAALGSGGCTDCHRPGSHFFFGNVLRYLFDEQARPVFQPQYELLGLSKTEAYLGAWRETYLKPFTYFVLALMCIGLLVWLGGLFVDWAFRTGPPSLVWRVGPLLIGIAAVVCLAIAILCPELGSYMLVGRFWLDSHHFGVSVAVLLGGIFILGLRVRYASSEGRAACLCFKVSRSLMAIGLAVAVISGAIMLLKPAGLNALTRYSYTLFDLAICLVALPSAGVAWSGALQQVISLNVRA